MKLRNDPNLEPIDMVMGPFCDAHLKITDLLRPQLAQGSTVSSGQAFSRKGPILQ